MNDMFRHVKRQFVNVDDWIMREEDRIVKTIKGYIIVPISKMYNLDNEAIDRFVISSKKGYNRVDLRELITKYINYFEKFYDPDRELLAIYYKIKLSIDCYTMYYTDENLIYDICKYFLSISMMDKITRMNNDNYRIKLVVRSKYIKEGQRYDDKHGKALLKLSLIIKLIIPILTHYMKMKRLDNDKNFILKVYDSLIYYFSGTVDLYNKIYETAISLIEKNADKNPIWGNQDINGTNKELHTMESVKIILLDMIPKYNYTKNIIIFNYTSIRNNIHYKITDSRYEYSYNPLSSIPDKTSDENNISSQFDRFENTLIKENEELYIQNKVNYEQTMKYLSYKYPVSNDEIIFYVRSLSNDGKFTIHPFQKVLIFYLFDSVFGDTVSINDINRTDYIKLMIMAKRILINNKLKLLPYVIGGKITKYNERKDINSKQRKKMEASQMFPIVQDKYKNYKIEDYIRYIMGTLLASEFSIIDYFNPDLHGLKLDMIEDYVIEETLMYASLI